MQRLALEEQRGEHSEDDERDDLLDDLELHERERSSVADETDAVRRNLARILEERDAPRKEDDGKQGPMGGDLHLLQLQVPVPGEGHEDVGNDEQKDGVEAFHIPFSLILSLHERLSRSGHPSPSEKRGKGKQLFNRIASKEAVSLQRKKLPGLVIYGINTTFAPLTGQTEACGKQLYDDY